MVALTGLTLRAALAAHHLQVARNSRNAILHATAVGFQLRFAFAASHADAAFLPGQVAPKAGQPRQQMLKLRQLNLEFAFPSSSALGKNIKDERGPVEDLAVEYPLQIAGLGWGKLVIKDDRIHVSLAAMQRELIRLALADISAGAGRGHLLDAIADNLATGRCCQLGKLLQRPVAVPLVAGLEFHADEKNPLSSSIPRLD